MTDTLVTVEQAAAQLDLHPKTVLRYIHEGRLPATRIGKAYRISRARLNAFAGIGERAAAGVARATCIVDIPQVSAEGAQRAAILLGAAAMSGDAGTPALELNTAFDPGTASLKVVMIGVPSDVASLLQLLQLQLQSQP